MLPARGTGPPSGVGTTGRQRKLPPLWSTLNQGQTSAPVGWSKRTTAAGSTGSTKMLATRSAVAAAAESISRSASSAATSPVIAAGSSSRSSAYNSGLRSNSSARRVGFAGCSAVAGASGGVGTV